MTIKTHQVTEVYIIEESLEQLLQEGLRREQKQRSLWAQQRNEPYQTLRRETKPLRNSSSFL